jgi:hypothetical protein
MRFPVAVGLLALVLAAGNAAQAARPIEDPSLRAWLRASYVAQRAAEWMFPRASSPFGTVTRRRGCDAQRDGSFWCSFDAAVWSSGRWHKHPPRTVEGWRCAHPIFVHVRRTRRGAITATADDACKPRSAANESEAGLLFIAAIHRRKSRLGRVRGVSCAGNDLFMYFDCYAATRRIARVRATVRLDGSVDFDGDPSDDPSDDDPPGGAGPAPPAHSPTP